LASLSKVEWMRFKDLKVFDLLKKCDDIITFPRSFKSLGV